VNRTVLSAQAYAKGWAADAAGLSTRTLTLTRDVSRAIWLPKLLLTVTACLGLLAAFAALYRFVLPPDPPSLTQAPAVKSDFELLQGTWHITALEMNGAKVDGQTFQGAKIILKGNEFKSLSMGAEYEGTFKIDPSASPKTLDMTFTKGPENGNTNAAIYKLEGDTWTICMATASTVRPTKFATAKGSEWALEELKRGDGPQTESAPAPRPAKAAATEESKKELERFAGEWEMVSGSIGGQAMPEAMLKTMKRVVKGDEVTVTMNGQLYFKATLTLDPSKAPRTIDYAMTEGMTKSKTQLGIYEWEDGTMRFSFAAPGKDRPADFTSKPGDDRTVSVWKRK
jgi:uncharacterized protein (TIGR03067 family)